MMSAIPRFGAGVMSSGDGLSDVLTPWSKLARGDLESVFGVYNVPIRNEVGRLLPRGPERVDEVARGVRGGWVGRMLKGGVTRDEIRGRPRDFSGAACRNAGRDQDPLGDLVGQL